MFTACGAAGDEDAKTDKTATESSATNSTATDNEVGGDSLLDNDITAPETQAEQALAADRERYQRYIDRLDGVLADNQSRQQNCSFYREEVYTVYTFGEGMYGWLLAAYDEQGIFLMDWLMETDIKEEEVLQR